MNKTLFLFILGVTFSVSVLAQSKSPVLFDYGKKSVAADEFLRMYTKNLNNKTADFSRKALMEYLDLYSLFKMKVAEAEELQIDTLPAIQQELGGYKKQLASTYLNNKEVTSGLVAEAYERKKKDVKVAHIMIGVKPNSDDTTAPKKTIDSIYAQIKAGNLSFEEAAKKYSDDKQSAVNGGNIGYITGLQVVYPFESAAYETAKGQISKPIRTIYGYHIIKKLDERAARGEIQVAQIMTVVRKSAGEAGLKSARAKIDSALAELKAGKKFDDVVMKYTEDEHSKNTNGVLPIFGIGRMVENYEDAAFALKKPGDFSEVIRTDNGFHIISLMKKIPLQPFEDEKKVLQKLVERDGRIKIAQQKFIAELKNRMNYKENPDALVELFDAIPDSTIRNGSYDPAPYLRMTKNVFTMSENDLSMNQADFANYIKDATRGRIYGPKNSTLRSLYDNYVEKVLLDYEEKQLQETNPEYKNLLQEYREGILIFELTDQTVWGKAPKDTVGLKNYYETHKVNYQWKPAVRGTIYKAKDENYAKAIVKELNAMDKLTSSEIVKKVNGDGPQDKVSAEDGKFEQSRFAFTKAFEVGKYMPYTKNPDGSYSILMVEEVFNQPTAKTFEEARGYVISDYQDELEKAWHDKLRSKYPIKVNDKVFNGLVK